MTIHQIYKTIIAFKSINNIHIPVGTMILMDWVYYGRQLGDLRIRVPSIPDAIVTEEQVKRYCIKTSESQSK